VLLFASAREIVGERKIIVKLNTDDDDTATATTATFVRKRIIEAYPKLSEIPFVLAVNRKVPSDETSTFIRPHDELAVLPPISGG
jgi:molybdopterin converting factor small subunit